MKPHYLILSVVVVLYAEACFADFLAHLHSLHQKPRQNNPSNKNSQSYLQSRKLNIQSQGAYSTSNVDNRYWDPNYNPNIPHPHIELTMDYREYEADSDEDSQPTQEHVLIGPSDYIDESEQEIKTENCAGDRRSEQSGISIRVSVENN